MGSGAVRGLLVDGALYTKEAVRRLLASTVAATPAVHAALGRLNHPVGLLTTPPLRLPHRGMEGAMEAFAAVGEALLDANAAGCRLDALVASTFQRHSLRGGERAANVAIGWDPQYLGAPLHAPPLSATSGTRARLGAPRCTARWRGRASPPSSGAPPSARTLCRFGCTRCCTRHGACGSTRRSTRRCTSSTRRRG